MNHHLAHVDMEFVDSESGKEGISIRKITKSSTWIDSNNTDKVLLRNLI